MTNPTNGNAPAGTGAKRQTTADKLQAGYSAAGRWA